MDINQLIAIVKNKLLKQINIETINIEDKSFLHKNKAILKLDLHSHQFLVIVHKFIPNFDHQIKSDSCLFRLYDCFVYIV